MLGNYSILMVEVEEAYKAFSIMKEGSKTDRLINISLWIMYFGGSAYLIYGNIINNKSIHFIISWICFLISFSMLFIFVFYIRNRESFIYSRKSSSEIRRMENFVVKLGKRNITSDLFEIIIAHYKNKMDRNARVKVNEIGMFLTYFSLPAIINILCTREDLHIVILVFAIFGILVVPGIIFTISLVLNKTINMYSNIIFYLSLYLENEKFEFIKNKEDENIECI